MNKYDITIGSDPEVFVERNGKIVSAIGMIPGSKHEPHPITDEGHMIQLDGIAMEFNIPPTTNSDDFTYHINFVKNYLKDVAELNGCTLSTKASDIIDDSELSHPSAKIFGCDPDFNVYLQGQNPTPDSNTNLRCVGGHIGIGYPNPDQEITEKIVKAFDLFVVLPSLLKDSDKQRRELYGKAGSFRFTPYGVECRALSNYWIHSDESMKWVFEQTIFAVNLVLDNEIDVFIEKYSKKAAKIINSSNLKAAEKLIKEIKLNFIKV